MHYGGEGGTACYKIEFLGENGNVFTIALQEALASVRSKHSDVVIMGIMDDSFILGEPLKVLDAYADMAIALRTLNLEYNATKNAMYVPDGVEITQQQDVGTWHP